MIKKFEVGDIELKILDNQTKRSKDELLFLYWAFNPRYRFFKNVKNNSKVLDVGAGTGGLVHWKKWGAPVRDDIEIYAVDLYKGEFFDKYDGFQVCNLEIDNIEYDNEYFDVIIMSHLLEHIKNRIKLLKELYRLLKLGGKAYIEVPTPETLNYPSRFAFLDKGINVSTLNFYDDKTHIRTFDIVDLQKICISNGFKVLETGIIENKYLEDELFTYGINHNDQEVTTYSIWSKLRWAQYLVIEKE